MNNSQSITLNCYGELITCPSTFVQKSTYLASLITSNDELQKDKQGHIILNVPPPILRKLILKHMKSDEEEEEEEENKVEKMLGLPTLHHKKIPYEALASHLPTLRDDILNQVTHNKDVKQGKIPLKNLSKQDIETLIQILHQEHYRVRFSRHYIKFYFDKAYQYKYSSAYIDADLFTLLQKNSYYAFALKEINKDFCLSLYKEVEQRNCA